MIIAALCSSNYAVLTCEISIIRGRHEVAETLLFLERARAKDLRNGICACSIHNNKADFRRQYSLLLLSNGVMFDLRLELICLLTTVPSHWDQD